MVFKYAYILPGFCCLWFAFTFLLTYGLAVLRKDVLAVFPYISDTGNWAPESCIFGLLLNIGSVLMSISFYIRYRQIRYLDEINTFKPIVKSYNEKGYYLGFLSAFGVCVVANFQETNLFSIHLVGASLCFGLGCVYQYLQVKISFEIYPVIGNKYINIFRAFCTAVCVITSLITSIYGILSLLQYEGEDRTKWTKNEYGFMYHIISAVAEWIMAIFTILFAATYTGEFKSIVIIEPEFIVQEKWTK